VEGSFPRLQRWPRPRADQAHEKVEVEVRLAQAGVLVMEASAATGALFDGAVEEVDLAPVRAANRTAVGLARSGLLAVAEPLTLPIFDLHNRQGLVRFEHPLDLAGPSRRE
jgi:hypothetical protein